MQYLLQRDILFSLKNATILLEGSSLGRTFNIQISYSTISAVHQINLKISLTCSSQITCLGTHDRTLGYLAQTVRPFLNIWMSTPNIQKPFQMRAGGAVTYYQQSSFTVDINDVMYQRPAL